MLVVGFQQHLQVGLGQRILRVQQLPVAGLPLQGKAVAEVGAVGFHNHKQVALVADQVADVLAAEQVEAVDGGQPGQHHLGGGLRKGVDLGDALHLLVDIFQHLVQLLQLALQLLAALGKQLVDLPVIHAVELVQLLDRAGKLAVKGDVAQVADGADVRKAVVVSAALKVAQPLLFIVAQGRDGDVEEFGNVADFQWVGRGGHLRYRVN